MFYLAIKLVSKFGEKIMDEFDDMEEQYLDDMLDSELLIAFMKSANKAAIKLTEMIIENNRHNDKRMSNEEIYQIYTDSFSVALSAAGQVQIQ